ncbi:hypothetical protein [Paraburkholderia dipogonis]|uniref:hypothetical protein n=1 Tax=Paraburkholderia dipogonis TaxID=1211383 RepID=UPI0038BB582C
MYEEKRYLAFDMKTAGCAGATANHAGAIFATGPRSRVQPRSSGIGGRRAGRPEGIRFVTRVWQSAIQKCFKLELQTSQIMTVQYPLYSQIGNLLTAKCNRSGF